MADADILAVPKIVEPQVEQPHKEITVTVCGQRIAWLTICPIKRIDARNKLQPSEILFTVKPIQLFDRTCILSGYDT